MVSVDGIHVDRVVHRSSRVGFEPNSDSTCQLQVEEPGLDPPEKSVESGGRRNKESIKI